MGVFPEAIRALLQEEIPQNLIDIDAIVLEEPVVNVRRSISVIYNTDNILSTVSAAMIKNLIDTRMSDDSKLVYDFQFIEIGNLHIENPSDGYLWLGIQPAIAAVDPEIRDRFNDAHHATIEKSWCDENSHFREMVNSINRDGEHSLVNANTFSHTAIDRFSSLVPEMGFHETWDLLINLHNIEKLIDSFHSARATVVEIITAWVTMQGALRDLGHPFYKDAFSPDADTVLVAYQQHREFVLRAFKVPSSNTGIYIDGVATRVIVLNMPSDFWMARRMIQMSGGLYHNTRLAFNGIHTESNVPGKLSDSRIGDIRTKSAY